ncbi:MAG: histidinol dehydrogenase, partial [Kiritimatiellaeota bacterium]|nr:histidinol dehydrogenase [Kiritimatiellota bacterium]
MNIPILAWSRADSNPAVEAFLNRPAFDPRAEAVATQVLRDIQARGAPAVLAAVKKFQGAALTLRGLRAGDAEIAAAKKGVPPKVRAAIRHSHENILAFAKAGMRRDWTMKTAHGGHLGEKFAPLDRVGVYVPGGTAPLVSTALMTVTL